MSNNITKEIADLIGMSPEEIYLEDYRDELMDDYEDMFVTEDFDFAEEDQSFYNYVMEIDDSYFER